MSGGLFGVIRNEHERLLKLVDGALGIVQQKEILSELWQFGEEEHHAREETLLFSKLLEKDRLREGGPFCVLYFDEHLSNSPGNRVQALLGSEPLWHPRQSIFKENHSPLSIPLEEHRSMRHLLLFLIQNQKSMSDQHFRIVFSSYSNILRHHIAKEEKCFFCLCEKLLTAEELVQIEHDWKLSS
ncbi:MAG: hypothetical protein IPM97_11405 [Bdellovibrionaceae bacterium]|nr:hypothetical protein [Pseudobdellovibrionaceae bacterium]